MTQQLKLQATPTDLIYCPSRNINLLAVSCLNNSLEFIVHAEPGTTGLTEAPTRVDIWRDLTSYPNYERSNIRSSRWSEEGKHLYIGSNLGVVTKHDVVRKEKVWSVDVVGDPLCNCAASGLAISVAAPDVIIVGDEQGIVNAYDTRQPKADPVLTFTDLLEDNISISQIEASDRNHYELMTSADNYLVVFDIRKVYTKQNLPSVHNELVAMSNPHECDIGRFSVSPNAKLLIHGDASGKLCCYKTGASERDSLGLWAAPYTATHITGNVSQQRLQETQFFDEGNLSTDVEVNDVFIYDDKSCLAACSDGEIRVFTTLPMEYVGRLPSVGANMSGVERIAMSYSYTVLAAFGLSPILDLQPLTDDVIEKGTNLTRSNFHKRMRREGDEIGEEDKSDAAKLKASFFDAL